MQAYYKELNLLLHFSQTEQRLVSEFRFIISLFKKTPFVFPIGDGTKNYRSIKG